MVARELGCEIVSADSRQFYAGLEIGSSAPPKEWLDEIPHHFVGTVPLNQTITAGEYGKFAREVCIDIVSRGKTPLVVGGSGLFVRALVDGFAPVPPGSPAIRLEIEQELANGQFESLFAELNDADPEYARLVTRTTPKRLIRALEVQRLSGKSFSAWHRDNQPLEWCNPMMIGLERPRPELRENIGNRTREMIGNGWLREVERLLALYSNIENFPPPAKEAVGYHLLAEVISGIRSLEEATELIIIATRQFAKRQMTWFRANKRTDWLMETGQDAPKRWAAAINERWRCFVQNSLEVR